MKIFWHNNGATDAEGNYHVEVQNDQGGRVSTFKGPDLQTITSQALTASAKASDELHQIKRNRQPDQAPGIVSIAQPRELSADERFQLAADLQDPAKAQEAMDRLIEARTGAKPAAIGQTLATLQERENVQRMKAEAYTFVANNPDYYPSDENKAKMIQALQLKRLDMTSNNLQIVYDELQSQGLLIERPGDDEQQEQPGTRQAAEPASESNLPRQTRPRQVSTSSGMRASQTSATPPPREPVTRITRAQLEQMSSEEYAEKMRDPKFVQMVNQMPRR